MKPKNIDPRDIIAACKERDIKPDDFLARIEKARLERLINETSAETGRLLEENATLNTKLPLQKRKWKANSDRIRKLFAQHDKMLAAYSKAGKR